MVKTEERDMDDICWMPHSYEIFDREDIEKRLQMLVPENSHVVFMSKIVEKDSCEPL